MKISQRLAEALRSDAQGRGSSGSSQDVVNVVPAGQRRMHRMAIEPEARAIGAQQLDVLGPQVGRALDAIGQNRSGVPIAKRRHAVVVRIEHGRARWRQCLDQAALLRRDLFDGGEIPDVSGANVGHDAHVRRGDLPERAHLARSVDPDLDHCRANLIGDPEQR